MLDTTSSFRSTSSSPSTENLPPIRIHVQENQKVGGLKIEEQSQHINFGVVGVGVNFNLPQKQEDVGGFVTTGVTASTAVLGVRWWLAVSMPIGFSQMMRDGQQQFSQFQ
ncbi:PB1 domain-containing protein [Forsythia ovata]|uniref:PB1 domain-containing protein n=1 Tax=Forsythia ovata TaxID=205694 RepID=A0ABD1TPZ1_9LAMI